MHEAARNHHVHLEFSEHFSLSSSKSINKHRENPDRPHVQTRALSEPSVRSRQTFTRRAVRAQRNSLVPSGCVRRDFRAKRFGSVCRGHLVNKHEGVFEGRSVTSRPENLPGADQPGPGPLARHWPPDLGQVPCVLACGTGFWGVWGPCRRAHGSLRLCQRWLLLLLIEVIVCRAPCNSTFALIHLPASPVFCLHTLTPLT